MPLMIGTMRRNNDGSRGREQTRSARVRSSFGVALTVCAAGCTNETVCSFANTETGGAASANVQENSGSGGMAGTAASPETGVAGASSTTPEPRIEIPRVEIPSVMAEDLGPGYHFVSVFTLRETHLVAEGGGPPIVVAVQGCYADEHIAMSAAHSGWHVIALVRGPSKWPVALACDGSACALFDDQHAERAGELGKIPASDVAREEWTTIGDEVRHVADAQVESWICAYTASTRHCFGTQGWEAVEPLAPAPAPHVSALPVCEDVVLVLYRNSLGVTANGQVVRIDNGATATRRCTVASEPLGDPLAFIEFRCGLSSNLWLLTKQALIRSLAGSSCLCIVD